MAPRQGFIPNRRVIRSILRDDPGVGAALDAIADPAAASAGGEVRAYKTDRQVRSIEVDADEQAVNGVATKALGAQGLTLS